MIEYNTFSGCSSLEEIILPSSLTQIKKNAFLGCSSLTQITIPYSVNLIKSDAFSGCSSLANVSFETPSMCVETHDILKKYVIY